MRSLVAAFLLCLFTPAYAETGIASTYANGDGHEWTKTANGEWVNPVT